MKIKNAVISGLAFALFFGLTNYFIYDLSHGLISGIVSGIIFGFMMYFFVNSKKIKEQTKINVSEDVIIYSDSANHFKGKEAVGGKLYLLMDRMVFKSHNINLQTHEQAILISDISEVLFYNSLGIIPNGLKIVMTNGLVEKFVVNKRKYWREEIIKVQTNS